MQCDHALLADIDAARPADGSLAVWWLGQHGFVLKSAETVLYVDAFLSPWAGRIVPPLVAPAAIGHADLVLGSHDHADHIDRAAWPAVAAASPTCRFVVPELVRDAVVTDLGLPSARVLGLNAGQTLELGDCRITGIAAAHELLDRDAATGRYPYLGFVIEANGCTVYHAGDCCIYDGLLATLQQWRFDAVCLPINGRDAQRLAAGCIGNMTYQEAADLAGALAPGLTIPTHFEMFAENSVDPALFLDYMRVKYPQLATRQPEHGRRIEITAAAASPGAPRPGQVVAEIPLTLGAAQSRSRPFAGIGVQCDAYLYDATNAAAGVGEADYALIESRLRALRPSLARTFCHVDWFNPAQDAATYRWDLPGYAHLRRLLRVLQEIGARVNLVLFAPFWDQPMATHRASVRAMGELLRHLRDVEGLDAVRWLTIFNEPETVFPHDSPLMRRLFGDARIDGPTRWGDLVELWALAQERLEGLGLHPHVRLAVPDCVYGSPVRYERMRLAAEAFRDAAVEFAVHVYSPEDQAGPAQCEEQRDWVYPGMAHEAADFRAMIGPDRRLILWEYNLEGLGGRTPWFPGVNRQGVAIMETPDAGAQILEKTLLAVTHGYDGACLWCLTDMLYCESPAQLMEVGLWRFKHARWYPRPHYYYLAPLCQLFRADMTRVPIDGVAQPLLALAARQEEAVVAVLLNRGATAQRVCLRNWPGAAQRLRIHPDGLPATGGHLPLDDWQAWPGSREGVLHLELLPNEATFLRTASSLPTT